MKQSKKRRFLALLLVCVLTLSLPLAVSAAEIKKVSLFTTYAGYVQEFVCTEESNKSFQINQLPRNAVFYITGYLYHTDTSSPVIRSGVCYWGSAEGYYLKAANLWQETTSGELIFRAAGWSSLSINRTYYGFIKNLASYGGVNGGNFEVYYKYT